MSNKKAIILLSGGLDSAVTLYFAKSKGFTCHCLAFDYGQRHRRELEAARKIVRLAKCPLTLIKIALPWGGSVLLGQGKNIPVTRSQGHKVSGKIPTTYVPARNIIFLSFALSFAEALKASAIFIGAHAQDYSGYPDCRPEFYSAFKQVAFTGTKTGVQHKGIAIKTPLIHKTKAEIIRLGDKLGVPFALTWSCYQGGKQPCGKCDSCYFRDKGFREAGIAQK